MSEILQFRGGPEFKKKIRETLSVYDPLRIMDQEVARIIGLTEPEEIYELAGYLLSQIILKCLYCRRDILNGAEVRTNTACMLYEISEPIFEGLIDQLKEAAAHNWGRKDE